MYKQSFIYWVLAYVMGVEIYYCMPCKICGCICGYDCSKFTIEL